MISQVLVAEETVAQLRTRIVRLPPQAGKLPYARPGAVLSHEADRGILRLPPPYRAPKLLPRYMWLLVV
jgi:hypothetical protein